MSNNIDVILDIIVNQQGLKNQVRGVANVFGNDLAGFLKGSIAPMLTVGFLANATKDIIKFGATLNKLRDRTGLDVKDIQKYLKAGEETGLDFGQIDKALRKLELTKNRALGGDNGLAKNFAEIGFSIQQLKSMSPQQMFDDLAERIQKEGYSLSDMEAAIKLLGNSARSVLPAMAQGFAAEAAEAAKAKSMTNEQAVAMDKLSKSWDMALISARGYFAVAINGIIAMLKALTLAASGGWFGREASYWGAMSANGGNRADAKKLAKLLAEGDFSELVKMLEEMQKASPAKTPKMPDDEPALKPAKSSSSSGDFKPTTDALARIGLFVANKPTMAILNRQVDELRRLNAKMDSLNNSVKEI